MFIAARMTSSPSVWAGRTLGDDPSSVWSGFQAPRSSAVASANNRPAQARRPVAAAKPDRTAPAVFGVAAQYGVFISPQCDGAPGARVMFARGAFRRSLRRIEKGLDVVGLRLEHDPDARLCTTADGSLKVGTSGDDLCFTVSRVNAAGRWAVGVARLARTMRKASVGCDVVAHHGMSNEYTGDRIIVVTEARLTEISLVGCGEPRDVGDGSVVTATSKRRTTPMAVKKVWGGDYALVELARGKTAAPAEVLSVLESKGYVTLSASGKAKLTDKGRTRADRLKAMGPDLKRMAATGGSGTMFNAVGGSNLRAVR